MLQACEESGIRIYDYQIVINGSITPQPVQFVGSYTFELDGREATRDLSATGTASTSLQSSLLKRVRVQRLLGEGSIAMTIYQDGEVIFEAPARSSDKPIVFMAPVTVPRS